MAKLRIVNARTMEKVLYQIGFERARQKGSHVFYRHPDGRRTTIPHHGNRPLARPLIREIFREIETTVEQYNRLIEEM